VPPGLTTTLTAGGFILSQTTTPPAPRPFSPPQSPSLGLQGYYLLPYQTNSHCHLLPPPNSPPKRRSRSPFPTLDHCPNPRCQNSASFCFSPQLSDPHLRPRPYHPQMASFSTSESYLRPPPFMPHSSPKFSDVHVLSTITLLHPLCPPSSPCRACSYNCT